MLLLGYSSAHLSFVFHTPIPFSIEKEIELYKIGELLYSVFLKDYQNLVNHFT